MSKDTKDKVNKLCEEALHYWGPDSQIDMAVEEMAELTKALMKLRRRFENKAQYSERVLNARDEVADVKLMMKQMELLLDGLDVEGEKVSDFKKFKVKRLDKRLEKYRN